MSGSAEAREWHRIIRASVRECLETWGLQAQAGPVTVKALETIIARSTVAILRQVEDRQPSWWSHSSRASSAPCSRLRGIDGGGATGEEEGMKDSSSGSRGCVPLSPERPDYFLPRRFAWMRRTLFEGLPIRPETGDRGPVVDALQEIVHAAGGLEHSREALNRAMKAAQEEFLEAVRLMPSMAGVERWAGANTPAVYYEFGNVVAWTRTVEDRYGDRLKPAVQHDLALWKELQKVRSGSAQKVFEDARQLAKCSLHKFTPPYPNVGATVEKETLIYPIPMIVDPEDFRANRLIPGRHATSIVEGFWTAVEKFIDGLLDIFHPTRGAARSPRGSGPTS